MINIAICEDDEKYQNEIKKLLEPYILKENIKIVVFENSEDVLTQYRDGNFFDIIYMDIELKGMTGVQAIKKIRQIDDSVIVIFITSHTNYISETFRVGAFQFLIKPIKRNDFEIDFTRALESIKSNLKEYIIQSGIKSIAIKMKDIYYVESYHRHLKFYTKKGVESSVGKMSDIEQCFKKSNIYRCHQGYLVNIKYIYQIEGNTIILFNGVELPISRVHKKEVLDAFITQLR